MRAIFFAHIMQTTLQKTTPFFMPKLNPVERALAKFEGSATKLAKALGDKVLRQHVEHWKNSGRVPPEHCPALRDLTDIAVWEFRPDDWYRIWPELIGTTGAPKVPPEYIGGRASPDPDLARPTANGAAHKRKTLTLQREPRSNASRER